MPKSYPGLDEAVLLGGTDVEGMDGVTFQPGALDNILAPMVPRGQNLAATGEWGEEAAELPLDAYTFTIAVTVRPTVNTDEQVARASVLANYKALLTAARGTGGLLVVTLRLTTGTGTHQDHTTDAQFLGISGGAWHDMWVCDVALQFRNLKAGWSTDGGTTYEAPF